jgi:hypothetical protein
MRAKSADNKEGAKIVILAAFAWSRFDTAQGDAEVGAGDGFTL